MEQPRDRRPDHAKERAARRVFVAISIALLTLSLGNVAFAAEGPDARRKGVFMGLDPAVALRVDESQTPLYARLDLRIGGCIRPRAHLGVDWRMDLLVTAARDAQQKRHEIGPVATFFLVRGWFARVFAHVGGFEPFLLVAGGQTGYEFSLSRFSAVGFALGGDADIGFDGAAPGAYSVSLALYLTAYDLRTRRGRED